MTTDPLFKLLVKHIKFHIRNGYSRWERLGHELGQLVQLNVVTEEQKEKFEIIYFGFVDDNNKVLGWDWIKGNDNYKELFQSIKNKMKIN